MTPLRVVLLLVVVFGLFWFFSDSQNVLIKKEDQNNREVKLLFVGDMMFDRTIRKRMESFGDQHIFSCVSKTLSSYDAVFGNLEGPITNNISVSRDTVPGDIDNMRFTFDPSVGELLKNNNFKAVSLANNHIFDFGGTSVIQTKENLTKNKIGWFGDPTDDMGKTFRGDGYVIVGFNQFLGVDSVDKTKKEIKRFKENGNVVIVFAHWGEEYFPVVDYQRGFAYEFVDSGADIVLGAHPHVVQEKEIYKNKHIYYSLGNFIFDQWWEESVSTGLGVEIVLKKGEEPSLSELYFKSSRDGRTCSL